MADPSILLAQSIVPFPSTTTTTVVADRPHLPPSFCLDSPIETPWIGNDFTPCFHESVIDAAIPLFLATLSCLILIGTLVYHRVTGNNVPHQESYLPIATSSTTAAPTTLRNADDDMMVGTPDEFSTGGAMDNGDELATPSTPPMIGSGFGTMDNFQDHLAAIAGSELTGRPLSWRDALKFLAAVVALGAHVGLLVIRRDEPMGSYLFVAPLVGVIVWSYITLLTLFHLTRPLNSTVSLTPHLSTLFMLNLPVAYLRLRSLVLHPGSQYEYFSAAVNFTTSLVLFYLAMTSGRSTRDLVVKPGQIHPCPEQHASLLATFIFSWLDPLIYLGNKQPLTKEDVWDFLKSDYSESVIAHFRQSIRETKKNYSFIVRLLINFRRPLGIQVIWAILWGMLTFVGPFGLERILNFLQHPDEYSTEWGYIYVFGMFFGMLAATLCQGQMLWYGRRVSVQLRSLIVGEIYAKALRRKDRAGQANKGGAAKEEDEEDDGNNKKKGKKDTEKENETEEQFTFGAINNMISTDTSEMSNASAYLNDIYILPLQIVVAIAFLYRVLGWSAMAGVGTMVAFLPVNIFLTTNVERIQDELMKATDKRAELMNELLQAIRVVKFFSWERNFYNKIDTAREAELKQLRLRFTWWLFGTALWFGTPVMVMVTTFFVYTKIAGHELTPEVAFPALALFNVLRNPMDAFPELLSLCLRAKVSAARIDRFLDEEEVLAYSAPLAQQRRKHLPGDPIIGFRNATFSYASGSEQLDHNLHEQQRQYQQQHQQPRYQQLQQQETQQGGFSGTSSSAGEYVFQLMNLNLEFPVGELSVIAGPTGSGKTSLLLSLLGEINPVQGEAFLPRRDSHTVNPVTGLTNGVAYVAQQAWLQNNTVRNNILFGAEFNQKRYDQVVDMCALTRDFEILEFGDKTEVGERGITLSGGQKQRICLARAVYSNAGHLLIDDALSAVDSHTANWLFTKCLMGPLMQGRTRILVTHAVSLTIRGASQVVVLKNGQVVANGTPTQVLESGMLGDDIIAEDPFAEHAQEDLHPPGTVAPPVSVVPGYEQVEDEHAAEEEEEEDDDDNKTHLGASTNSVSALGGKGKGKAPAATATGGPAAAASSSTAHTHNISSSSTTTVTEETAKDKEAKKLIGEEHKTDGSVSWKVSLFYFGSMGGLLFWIFLLSAFVTMQVFQVASDTWLRFWAGASQQNGFSSMAFSTVSTSAFADSDSSAVLNGSSLLMSFACQYRSSLMSGVIGGGQVDFSESQMRLCRPEVYDSNQPMSPLSATVDYHGPSEVFMEKMMDQSSPSMVTSPYQYTMSDTTLSAAPAPGHSVNYYLSIYVLLSFLYILTIMVRQAVQYSGVLAASRKIHRRLLSKILNSPVRFFDTTPLGRIMNRFTKDIETVDQEVAPIASNLLFGFLSTLTVIGVIAYVTPQFLIAAFFISILFSAMAVLYVRSSRELKRLESIAKSPIFSHFGESLVGVSTIRAFGQEKRFQAENLVLMDDHNRPFFYLWACNRWLSIRVDVLSALVAFLAGLLIVVNRDHLDAAKAGLSLSYALTFTDHVLWLVRLYSNNEMNMNSVERVMEYMDLVQEPPAVIEGTRPTPGWPQNGEIHVENLVMQYSPDDPPVIKDVSFSVQPKEKIGIVGRTGAGKSTLAIAFFRFMELTSGKIVVDGIDISTLGVHDLRSSLTIIPQDPVLFMGTVRSNLDPFQEHDDANLWAALKRVHLISNDTVNENGEVVEAVNTFGNLDTVVQEQGNNFSSGEKQLLSLARALLRQSKVVLLDEATSNVDTETDSKIQETIREEMKHATLLTIAHRLRTIIDYDKVLVMDHGKLAQFDTPWNLIRQEGGIFRGMCQRSGEFELLVEMAKESSERSQNGGVSASTA